MRFLAAALIAALTTNIIASEAKKITAAPGAYNIDLTRYDFIDTSLNVIQFPRGNASFNSARGRLPPASRCHFGPHPRTLYQGISGCFGRSRIRVPLLRRPHQYARQLRQRLQGHLGHEQERAARNQEAPWAFGHRREYQRSALRNHPPFGACDSPANAASRFFSVWVPLYLFSIMCVIVSYGVKFKQIIS